MKTLSFKPWYNCQRWIELLGGGEGLKQFQLLGFQNCLVTSVTDAKRR